MFLGGPGAIEPLIHGIDSSPSFTVTDSIFVIELDIPDRTKPTS